VQHNWRASQPAPRSPDGSLPPPNYIAAMCGRATYKLTWEEIVALHRLTLGQPQRQRNDWNKHRQGPQRLI